MTHAVTSDAHAAEILTAADRAVRAIPPVWPLASSVAVNPFLGQAHEMLASVGARLERVAGVRVTMPRSWYAERIASGLINDADLGDALARAPSALRPESLAALKAAAREQTSAISAAPTIADLAAKASGVDWTGLIAERFGAWAAGYFDEGQALWAAPRGKGAYGAWRAVATHDLTPEIVGLAGFATYVSETPERAPDAIASLVQRLALPPQALDTYFHQMLMTLGGWSQYARYKLWQAELAGGADSTTSDFLAIRLIWEAALLERYESEIGEAWKAVAATHAAPLAPTRDNCIDAVLQDAADRAAQRGLAETLAAPSSDTSSERPALQAAFCIDVRSEVFRRALESIDANIQTMGFAGFFGLAASHRRFASDVQELRLPVLLNPGMRTCSGAPDDAAADQTARVKARASRAWG
ncbi:MAG: DUF2309 domain-containing protein, partial [Beijerinckiaceae bacterium]|nr:DUF2309 domain-containing protein [Beijerinckiaceae bacterium]